MPVDTTLYIHKNTLRLIKNAMALTGKKRNQIIILLLKKAMMDKNLKIKIGKTIKYQEDDIKDNWHTVHVWFREDEIDYFKDLRNFFKMSDSLILALAARNYFQEIIKRKGRNDNYQFLNYVLSREIDEGVIFWKICWGLPKKPDKHFKL